MLIIKDRQFHISRQGMSTCVFRYAKLVEAMEEKCLKKSRHFPAKDAIYETPSDYDPLALNMGQLVVHRISLRFNHPCHFKSNAF